MAELGNAIRQRQGGWRSLGQRTLRLGRTYGAAAMLLLITLYNALWTPNFLTQQTLRVNLTQVSTIVIVAVGMTLVVATGGIDLSVGALMAFSGVLAPMLFTPTSGPLSVPLIGVTLAFVLPVLAAGGVGLFNGALVTYGKIQPFIATLIVLIAGRGIAQALTRGNLVTFKNPAFQFIGQGSVLGVRAQVLLMLAVVGLAAWVMGATAAGRQILAVGGNEEAARLAGVPIRRVKLAVYAASGALAGLAGLIVIAINASADANQIGLNMELDAIAAVAVGGTSLNGGRAVVVGTFVGALMMQLIRYTLLAHGIPDAAALVIKAGIIVLAVAVQRQPQA
ncbi:MAG TPA: ABC transporter permease [Herpetosiphonaceae bacterium]